MLPLLVVALTVIANCLIAIVVYFNNRKSATNILLSSLSLINAGWTLLTYFALFSEGEDVRLFFVRSVMVITSSFGPNIYLLAKSFPGSRVELTKKSLGIIGVFALISTVLSLTPLTFSDLTNTSDGGFNLTPGPAIVVYGMNLMIFMTMGFVTIIKKFSVSTGIMRRQTGYFLTGLILTFTLATITNFIAVVVFKTVKFTYVGPPLTLILIFSVTYAIVRHRLLDIRALVSRTISYTLVIFVVVAGYVLLLFAFAAVIPALQVSGKQIIAFSIISIVLFFTSSPLKHFVEKATDKVFFQSRYDSEKLLSTLTHIMASELDIKILSTRLLSVLNDQMKVVNSAFIVIDRNKQQIEIEEDSNSSRKRFQLTNDELEILLLGGEISIFEELSEGEAKMIMRKHDASIFMPLRTKESMVGFLLFGPKASGDIYSSQDIDVLKIFSGQVAVALQNSLAYLEIQEFSRTLEKKVDERTRELKETQARELSKAQELLKLKDEFVFIATHDLKTPVTAIDGYISLIKEDKPAFSPEIEENFKAVEEASGRLKQLVNDLLQVARNESGTVKVEALPVDISKIIEQVVREVTPAAEKKKVKLTVNIDKASQMVMADEFKLPEVIENLMSNAVKFSKDSAGEIKITTQKKDNMLEVSVADNGHGIPQAEQAKIFQKFFKYRSDTTRDVPGTGLGLFVVRMLVEKMGGKIGFTSEEEKGTTFTFTLPLAK